MNNINKRKIFSSVFITISVIIIALFLRTDVSSPRFSHSGGFYEASFYLEIKAPEGCSVYYTTDGSTPGPDSIRYTEPLLITDATSNANVYCTNPDLTAGFTANNKFYSQGISVRRCNYRTPDYPVEKCNIIRAVAIGKNGSISSETCASFFIGLPQAMFDGCGTISLISAPENLFDHTNGIYVGGKALENYLSSSEEPLWDWHWWDANYINRGIDWERPATIHIFDNHGNQILNKNIGIRIQGNWSRASLPRGLNLYVRPEYDNSLHFNVDFFNTGYNAQKLTLSAGGNDTITLFNDHFISCTTENLNYATANQTPYVLFLDGEYWGVYWLSEKFDKQYISHYYNVSADNVVMIKNGKLEEGKPEDISLFDEMTSYILSNDMSDPNNYALAGNIIDIDSFIDYYATMIYIARVGDWPSTNYALWRTKEYDDNTYSDCRWRWMMFDCNSPCMGTDNDFNYQHNTLQYVLENDAVFASMWKNTDFRNAFSLKIKTLAKENFAPENVNSFIGNYTAEMYENLTFSWKRFYGSQNTEYKNYSRHIESIRYFFENRAQTIDSWQI